MIGSRRGQHAIVLASASPRRVELLESAGLQFQVEPSGLEETVYPDESPDKHAARLSREKALDVAAKVAGRFFIGADTIVVCNGEIMGKPKNESDAERMLLKLSGIAHEVITGFAIYDKDNDKCVSQVVKTLVYFKDLQRKEVLAYIATGCPMDKAGAYAIQGGAAYMIRKITGSYTNVVGLPLCEVIEALQRMGAI